MAVLKCINDVKRDFWFATRAHVQYVSDTISKGCSARKGTISYYCNIPLVRFCFITYDVDLYQDYQKLYNFVSQLIIQRVIISEKVSMNYVEIYLYQSQLATNTEIIENCTIVCHKITKNCTIVCHKITKNCTIFGDLSVFLLRHMIIEINLILYLGISTATFTTVDYKASREIVASCDTKLYNFQ